MNGRGWEKAAQAEGTAEKEALRGQQLDLGLLEAPVTGFGRQNYRSQLLTPLYCFIHPHTCRDLMAEECFSTVLI